MHAAGHVLADNGGKSRLCFIADQGSAQNLMWGQAFHNEKEHLVIVEIEFGCGWADGIRSCPHIAGFVQSPLQRHGPVRCNADMGEGLFAAQGAARTIYKENGIQIAVTDFADGPVCG